jgi:hypothetical protein
VSLATGVCRWCPLHMDAYSRKHRPLSTAQRGIETFWPTCGRRVWLSTGLWLPAALMPCSAISCRGRRGADAGAAQLRAHAGRPQVHAEPRAMIGGWHCSHSHTTELSRATLVGRRMEPCGCLVVLGGCATFGAAFQHCRLPGCSVAARPWQSNGPVLWSAESGAFQLR